MDWRLHNRQRWWAGSCSHSGRETTGLRFVAGSGHRLDRRAGGDLPGSVRHIVTVDESVGQCGTARTMIGGFGQRFARSSFSGFLPVWREQLGGPLGRPFLIGPSVFDYPPAARSSFVYLCGKPVTAAAGDHGAGIDRTSFIHHFPPMLARSPCADDAGVP
jgi:hypothetical protein